MREPEVEIMLEQNIQHLNITRDQDVQVEKLSCRIKILKYFVIGMDLDTDACLGHSSLF